VFLCCSYYLVESILLRRTPLVAVTSAPIDVNNTTSVFIATLGTIAPPASTRLPRLHGSLSSRPHTSSSTLSQGPPPRASSTHTKKKPNHLETPNLPFPYPRSRLVAPIATTATATNSQPYQQPPVPSSHNHIPGAAASVTLRRWIIGKRACSRGRPTR